MKFILSFILFAVICFIACMYLPWWSIAVIAFLIALTIPQRPFVSFLCAFLSLFFLWAGLSYWLSYKNGNILVHKLSILIFTTDVPVLMIIFTGLIGGIVAGFAALAGSYLRYKPVENIK